MNPTALLVYYHFMYLPMYSLDRFYCRAKLLGLQKRSQEDETKKATLTLVLCRLVYRLFTGVIWVVGSLQIMGCASWTLFLVETKVTYDSHDNRGILALSITGGLLGLNLVVWWWGVGGMLRGGCLSTGRQVVGPMKCQVGIGFGDDNSDDRMAALQTPLLLRRSDSVPHDVAADMMPV